MIGSKTEAYQLIREYSNLLLNGVVVSIDPSVGSSSSLPGYAVYRAGELIFSGKFPIPHRNMTTVQKLRILHNYMTSLYAEVYPDILVFEDVPSQRYGGNISAHASLLKAVGVIVSVPGTEVAIGIAPVSWKAMARGTYVKGDVEDAIEIGWVAIEAARQIQAGTGRSKKNRKQKENMDGK